MLEEIGTVQCIGCQFGNITQKIDLKRIKWRSAGDQQGTDGAVGGVEWDTNNDLRRTLHNIGNICRPIALCQPFGQCRQYGRLRGEMTQTVVRQIDGEGCSLWSQQRNAIGLHHFAHLIE